MDEREQQILDQLGNLTLELNVTRLVVLHLAARVLRTEPDPQAAFRRIQCKADGRKRGNRMAATPAM